LKLSIVKSLMPMIFPSFLLLSNFVVCRVSLKEYYYLPIDLYWWKWIHW